MTSSITPFTQMLPPDAATRQFPQLHVPGSADFLIRSLSKSNTPTDQKTLGLFEMLICVPRDYEEQP